MCLWDKEGGLLPSEGGRLPATSGSFLCSQLLSDSATQLPGHSAQQELQEAQAHPAVPLALPDVEDTIFPGQPKHAPSSLGGGGKAGWEVQWSQKQEPVAGEVRRELGSAGLEKGTGKVLKAGRD